MANIKDIAKMAGVSVTTVSRVMNNQPYVSKEKREAVLKAVKESNYQRNINAIHLKKGKTFLIGVVLPFSDHPYFAQLVKGIASEALKHNYKLVLFQTNYEESRETEALDMLKHKQIDAVIICSRICNWSTIDEYVPYGPIVLCEDTRQKNVSSTFVDHYKSFSSALEYINSKGHNKIGYCIGRRTGTNSKLREQAYRDFLKKINKPFHADYIFDQCLNFEDGEQVIQTIKEMNDPPSALLVTSDQVAAGIVTCCQNENISIPNDLAIVGFDNQPIAEMMGITTFEIPLVEIGRKLFIQAFSNDTVSHEEVSGKLIERRTV
ncbi:LacI family DNA-binding transcriptional regulator [Domibacillus sp. DTU_2020_1001157_1_SI_ALB_TIR_016]|uniref:LacI family DNA-binding transcriptional regulator n=1 Tax=Domibacillus sp. DTU_2020_1001157_1_SI_ALB_TIR_016 TaxID=3077789 RepID=UPI0028EA2ED9|nr:LacI family DNA-binding transcriptional regulator [Domibacillus sp. DTU_2020_1001157_1_SI_ALB_TIR_016]WNS78783.1 LacI family DNA-binding transcriptional regulator [Domibacillus sp. DTU_2020_1001157_1_SI_ALB_TIR_016]